MTACQQRQVLILFAVNSRRTDRDSTSTYAVFHISQYVIRVYISSLTERAKLESQTKWFYMQCRIYDFYGQNDNSLRPCCTIAFVQQKLYTYYFAIIYTSYALMPFLFYMLLRCCVYNMHHTCLVRVIGKYLI